MGYFVELVDCNVFIPKTSFESACTHLKNVEFLTDFDHMNGGGWDYIDNQKKREHWYSWVNMQELRTAIETNDLPKVFESFRFVVILNNNGDIYNLGFHGKIGDEEHLLHSLKSFFREGDYLQWRGEEGELWKVVFENGCINFYDANIIWTKS